MVQCGCYQQLPSIVIIMSDFYRFHSIHFPSLSSVSFVDRTGSGSSPSPPSLDNSSQTDDDRVQLFIHFWSFLYQQQRARHFLGSTRKSATRDCSNEEQSSQIESPDQPPATTTIHGWLLWPRGHMTSVGVDVYDHPHSFIHAQVTRSRNYPERNGRTENVVRLSDYISKYRVSWYHEHRLGIW